MTVYAHTVADQSKLDDVPVTIKLTLQLGTWRQFSKTIDESRWPSCDVYRAITDAVNKIEGALAQCGAGPMGED